MIDLHCHIIFETDDGAKTLENSINMLKEAYQAGFTKICCTPHYLEPQYIKTKKENAEKLQIIKEKLKKENINIDLYLGNEIYISENIESYIRLGKVSTIADSNYVLVELPLINRINSTIYLIKEIIDSGYKVILAHPERYLYVQKDIKYLDEFINLGVYLQGNYESLIGKYGFCAQKTLKKLLKQKKISLMGTDTHREHSTYTKMEKILKVLRRYAKNDYFENITEKCQEEILKNT